MTQIKLFYSPGACSLAPHIVLGEIGAPYELVRLALHKGEQRTPENLTINPKGRVPALVEDGWALPKTQPSCATSPAFSRDAAVARRARPEARCAEWLAWILNRSRRLCSGTTPGALRQRPTSASRCGLEGQADLPRGVGPSRSYARVGAVGARRDLLGR